MQAPDLQIQILDLYLHVWYMHEKTCICLHTQETSENKTQYLQVLCLPVKTCFNNTCKYQNMQLQVQTRFVFGSYMQKHVLCANY